MEITVDLKELRTYLRRRLWGSAWSNRAVYAHCLKNGRPWQGLMVHGEMVALLLYSQAGDSMDICFLETHISHRRKGWMGLMLKAFLDTHGDHSVWLEVSEANQSAVALYQKMGFTSHGVRKSYYSDGSDGWVMCRQAPGQSLREAR